MTTLTPGTLLCSTGLLFGTGFPDGNNVIAKDRMCVFLDSFPFNTDHNHYRILVLDYGGHPIVDDVIATAYEFQKWFSVVHIDTVVG